MSATATNLHASMHCDFATQAHASLVTTLHFALSLHESTGKLKLLEVATAVSSRNGLKEAEGHCQAKAGPNKEIESVPLAARKATRGSKGRVGNEAAPAPSAERADVQGRPAMQIRMV
ncbi:hypothetical protein HaLaN_06901 [Haematococcus lacustris]|uniref:Uncharacterized protein n=1 Tax=Haematococcus lacustris TaxID=44745 RepID=A0A699YXX1_HAELA|nr:hypothetical protein HaLaN_06901 [Haematococcus lacustris]